MSRRATTALDPRRTDNPARGATRTLKKDADMDAEFRAREIVTTKCAFCPWEFTGNPDVARDAYATHRIAAHDERAGMRPEPDGRQLLDQMDRGEPLTPPATTNGDGMDTCKVEGCTEPYLTTHGRWGKLCATHKQEKLEEAKRDGSLGHKRSASPPAPRASEPEPDPEPRQPDPAPVAEQNGSGDILELIANGIDDVLIAFHERESTRHAEKAAALRQIRETVEALD